MKGKITTAILVGLTALFLSAAAPVHADLNDGLIAYYPFNGNANDASGNGNNGTLSNSPTFSTGVLGSAVAVTTGRVNSSGSDYASGSYVSLPMFNFASMGSFTIAIWVKEDSLSIPDGEAYVSFGDHIYGWLGIGRLGTYAGSHDAQLCFSVGSRLVSGPAPLVGSWSTADQGIFVHYALVYTNGTISGYKNGVLQGTQAQTVNIYGSNAAVAKHWWDGGNSWSTRLTGSFDELRIYNRALSPSEIQQLYTAASGLNTGLVAYYPFNGNADDASGNGHNGVLVGSPTLIPDRLGNLNKAYSFNGTSDYISIPNVPTLATPTLTVSVWVRLTSYGTDGNFGRIILSDYGWDSSSQYFCGYVFFVSNTGKVGLRLASGNPSVPFGQVTGQTAIPLFQWVHVAASYDGNTLRAYVNGAQDAVTNYSTYCWTAYRNTDIGNAPWNPVINYSGWLDEVRLYNRALSASEVQQLAGNTLAGITITGSSTVSAGSVTPYTCTATFSEGGTLDVSTAAQWSIVGSAPAGTGMQGPQLTAGVPGAPTTVTIRVTYNSPAGQLVANYNVTIGQGLSVTLGAPSVRNAGTGEWDIDITATISGASGYPSCNWTLDGEFLAASGSSLSNFRIAGSPGTRTLVLQVTDGLGRTASASKLLTLNKLPVAHEPATMIPAADPVGADVLDWNGNAFAFDSSRTNVGLIVITHGIWSSGIDTWPRVLAIDINDRLVADGKPQPNICIIDWRQRADPTGLADFNQMLDEWNVWGLNWTKVLSKPAGDTVLAVEGLVAIRPFAVNEGECLADWISQQITAGNISPNAPIHLIGHSAGGFLVSECALQLKRRLGILPQVTTLDTPFFFPSDTKYFTEYPTGTMRGKTERYYASGGLGSLLTMPGINLLPSTLNYYLRNVPSPYINPIDNHQYVHDWYDNQTTILDGPRETDGFYYSPFMGNGFHGWSGLSAAVTPKVTLQSVATITEIPLDGFSSFGNVVVAGGAYTVKEEANAGVFKSMVLPIGAQTVKFRYQFTSPGDGDFLSVHWGTNGPPLYVGSDIAFSRADFVEAEVSVAQYAGLTNTLVFKLNSRGNPNAILVIDQIRLTISDDPDEDGLTTNQEEAFGTNPLLADTDGDGLSDGDEISTTHTNPLMADTDGDGSTDRQECVAGANPNDPASVFQVTKMTQNPDGSIGIEWSSAAGKSYSVFRTTDLSWNNFTTLTNGVAATPPSNTFTDTTATGAPFYFYRVGVE